MADGLDSLFALFHECLSSRNNEALSLTDLSTLRYNKARSLPPLDTDYRIPQQLSYSIDG